jgi:phosphoserine aminotransferase
MNSIPNKPSCPYFSSGPCKKYPSFNPKIFSETYYQGRSLRCNMIKDKIEELTNKTKNILKIPDNYQVGFVSGSDSGAVEMALWNMIGYTYLTIFDFGPFSRKWADDVTKQLKFKDTNIYRLPIGETPDESLMSYPIDNDLLFTFNVTGTGYFINDVSWISDDRTGITIADATSIVFASPMPWSKLDVTTFSMQKVLGGEGGLGVIVLSPRAIERLNMYTPSWPIPNILRMKTSNGDIRHSMFKNFPVNTISLMTLIDYECALNWVKYEGGVDELNNICWKNQNVLNQFINEHNWCHHLISDNEHLSPTVTCIVIEDMSKEEIKKMLEFFEVNQVAFDIGSYPTAPPGIRIWTGPTINTQDLVDLTKCIEWYHDNKDTF